MVAMKSFGLTDTGKVRPKNEDYFDLDDAHQLYVVADGMGGHVGGAVASRICTETVHDFVAEHLESSDEPSIDAILRKSFVRAHKAIVDATYRDDSLLGMGSTIIAAILQQETLTIAHLGDCRAYRLRDGKLQRLTHDHSFVAAQIRAGRLTEDQARTHPLRSVVTRGLGGFKDEVEASDVEITEASVCVGDRFLLCSDGLTDMLTDEEIDGRLQADNTVKAAAIVLLHDANKRGGKDNITLVLLSAEDIEPNKFSERRNPAVYSRLYAEIFRPPSDIAQTASSAS